MASRISGPKILLLQCSIIYQRVEGKLLSLEPVIMQVNLVKLFSVPEVKIPGNNQFLSGIKNLHLSIGDSCRKRVKSLTINRSMCKIVHRTGIFSFRVKCSICFNKKLYSSSN